VFPETTHGGDSRICCQGPHGRYEVSCGFIGDADIFQREEGDSDVTSPLLRLYIAGPSAASRRAEQNLRRLRDVAKATDPLEVEIIDVLKNPELAEQAAIIATPTLAYEHPVRPRRIIGDLSDVGRVLDFLGIEAEGIKL
jgi:circadian clock protein KaiB